ncbi:unnamed protein product [Paramecium sonneborni]|uniref:VWFA domain-containing protein n=1 Tax=Paramecium sonneborni TaxID=65129 RepID=A0A8S1R689_9CILI|nr:unnamed protein product [Paramecium sonneborni]
MNINLNQIQQKKHNLYNLIVIYNPEISESLHSNLIEYSEGINKTPPLFICYDINNKLPIQLESVNYIVNVQPGIARVEIQQLYRTQHYQVPISLEYMFIIDKQSAVSKIVAELGEEKVQGIVKELEEVKQEYKYKERLKQGEIMILSQQDKQNTDLKKVRIGCLAPRKILKITFEYIQPLKVYLNQFWILEISSIHQLQNQQFNYYSFYKQVQQSIDLKRLEQNYKQNIIVTIHLQNLLTFVKSPTHQIKLENNYQQFFNVNQKKSQVISLDNKYPQNFDPTKNFSLLFQSNDINQPHSFLTHTNNHALQHVKFCATLTLIPKFNQLPPEDAYNSYINDSNVSTQTKMKRENYLFLIDRSGSMEGTRIKKAKQSLFLFIKSLPEDCLFNVISFGSNSKKMFEESQQYNQESQDKAIDDVNKMEANFGGTDIYKALQVGIYNRENRTANLETINAFILTDGDDSPERIIDLVKNENKANYRIYALGIGDGCNQNLLKSITEIGNGKCHFVADNEDINAKVIDLLDDSMTYYLKGFKIDFPKINVSQIIPDPESLTSIKQNEELVIQVLFANPIQKILDFHLSCYDPQENKKISYKYTFNINESQQSEYFHKLAAHKFINYYENSQQLNLKKLNKIKVDQWNFYDQDLINLSIENQILCSKTAFICEICNLKDNFKQQITDKIYFQNQKVESISDQYSKDNDSMDSESSDNSMDQCMQPSDPMQVLSSVMPLCIQEPDIQCCQEENQEISKDQYDQTQKLNSFEQKKYGQTVLINYIDLFKYVQANGSFILDERTNHLIKLFSLENENHLENILWATIVSLFYLELHCQNDKASWQQIYQKGIKFLQKNGQDFIKIKAKYFQKYKNLFQSSN